jgi:cell division topological specificity factor
MALFDFFRRSEPTSASMAKDRLQIIVTRERAVTSGTPDYLARLKQELLEVISKYEKVDLDRVSVNLERNHGFDVLELNIVLADDSPPMPLPRPRAALSAPRS